MREFIIKEDLLQMLLNYLVSQPYQNVWQIINQLQQLPQMVEYRSNEKADNNKQPVKKN